MESGSRSVSSFTTRNRAERSSGLYVPVSVVRANAERSPSGLMILHELCAPRRDLLAAGRDGNWIAVRVARCDDDREDQDAVDGHSVLD